MNKIDNIDKINNIDNLLSIDDMFNNMLNEAYKILEYNEPIIYNLNLPQLDIEITSNRIYWKNLDTYLKILNRDFDHFMIFIKNEFCDRSINWYSNNKIDGIIIHGKYLKQNNIIDLVKKYINTTVICSSCFSPNTTVNRSIAKKYIFNCIQCNMTKIL